MCVSSSNKNVYNYTRHEQPQQQLQQQRNHTTNKEKVKRHQHAYNTAKDTFQLLYDGNGRRRKSLTSTTARAQQKSSVVKWKIIISSIIFLLCRSSHVHAIRKGRLMSPSSFTALSGDLHVQIQFSGNAGGDNGIGTENTSILSSDTRSTTPTTFITTTTTTRKGTGSTGVSQSHLSAGNNSQGPSIVENTIMSTLVISKFIDEVVPESYSPEDYHGGEEGNKNNNKNQTANDTEQSSSSNLNNGTTPEHLLQRKRKEVVQNIPLYPDPRYNVTQIAVPCQTFMRGGLYEMQVITNMRTTALVSPSPGNQTDERGSTAIPTMITTTLMPVNDERLRQTLDVRWPSAEMIVSPVRLRTYPESPVEVKLRFPEVNCEPALSSQDLPEFWLELVYCGKERSCTELRPQNITKTNILYAEQVRGYPKQKTLKLKCELFGLAGNYAVQLRPMIPAPNVPITRRFISVDWSDKFVFNVYARSIFPCDPHTGIGVLYEYPGCILEQGDRVRVYAKLRADVASLKPPTSLHYVAEQRVVKSQYSLYFSCDLFTEKYIEYCFVYVSQAISGAVADVRMDCVPTLPVSDSDTGGWGQWSEWTPCSTNCLGGTRNRYRFCDSPPPRYGAKFCEGSSVQTEKCGKSISDSWDCIYETSGANLNKANRTEVSQEIGPGCRCGCIVHLGSSKLKRIIAGATQSCPGRSFWLIQVDGEETISLNLNFMQLPCTTQYIKIRDGPSLSSTLLVQLNGGIGLPDDMESRMSTTLIESSGAQLLVEFFAGEEVTSNVVNATTSKTTSNTLNAATCTGGFMANVEQILKAKSAEKNASSTPTLMTAATRLSVKSRVVLQNTKTRTKFTIVHLSAVVFASIIILISALLGAQYVVRYRKYHLAVARRRDEGSRLHTPCASLTSLQSPPSRAMSTTTLLSEVIYMVKMRPKHQLRHSILRESIDAEQLARETEFNEDGSRERMVKCDEEDTFGSTGSVLTLRNELTSDPISGSFSQTPSSEEVEGAVTTATAAESTDISTRSGTLTRKDSAKDSESIISSGMSSICNSPPMNTKRLSKYSDRYDAVTLKIRNSRLDDSSSLRSGSFRLSQLGARSASASLTNGCYSPAGSVLSTATIRTTNAKESKEKQNRKKLLARPGSEFSLGNPEDMELDYYDYNVINAGAAPGSYLGMDPAYLIWIPPFEDIIDGNECEDDDDKTPEPANATEPEEEHEPDETEPLYEEIKMPKYGHYLSPCSNTESLSKSNTTDTTTPTSDELSPLNSKQHSKATTPSETNQKNSLLQKTISVIGSCGKPSTPYMSRKQRRQAKQQSKSTLSLGTGHETAAAVHKAISSTKSAREIAVSVERDMYAEIPDTEPNDSMNGSYVEKETSVVKSPSDLQGFLALDDIQFADESESDHDAKATLKRQSAPMESTTTTEYDLEPAIELQTRKTKLNDFKRHSSKAREFAV